MSNFNNDKIRPILSVSYFVIRLCFICCNIFLLLKLFIITFRYIIFVSSASLFQVLQTVFSATQSIIKIIFYNY